MCATDGHLGLATLYGGDGRNVELFKLNLGYSLYHATISEHHIELVGGIGGKQK